MGAGSSKYNFPSFSPTGYVPSLNWPPGVNVIFSCLTTERFERYETPSVSFQTRSGSLGSGFVSVMSVASCLASLAYCFLPLSLNFSGTLSQQVSATKASASCFSKACLAAATNRASSSGDAARTGCNRKTKIAVRANNNVFIGVVYLAVRYNDAYLGNQAQNAFNHGRHERVVFHCFQLVKGNGVQRAMPFGAVWWAPVCGGDEVTDDHATEAEGALNLRYTIYDLGTGAGCYYISPQKSHSEHSS